MEADPKLSNAPALTVDRQGLGRSVGRRGRLITQSDVMS